MIVGTCQVCGNKREDVFILELAKNGFSRIETYCAKCETETEHKIERINMSQETINPEANKVTPANAREETPRPALLAGVSEEHLGMVLSIIGDLSEAITDIPAQLELLSRVTLAKSFISKTPEGYNFAADKFARTWELLSGENEQKAG